MEDSIGFFDHRCDRFHFDLHEAPRAEDARCSKRKSRRKGGLNSAGETATGVKSPVVVAYGIPQVIEATTLMIVTSAALLASVFVLLCPLR
jgi:hypothetical protein